MELEFEKWHGFKNDFVLFRISKNEVNTTLKSIRELAPQICKRDALGIGADGVLVVIDQTRDLNQDNNPQELIILNKDGSQAKHCGNGVRCAATSNYRQALKFSKDPSSVIEFVVGEKIVTCETLKAQTSQKNPYILCYMGVPRLDKKPTQMETQVETDLTQIGLGFLLEDWATVELNNKHLVFINSDAQKKHLEKIGKELASQPTWKDYNIHIAVSQSLTKESKQQSTRILGSPITESYQSWTWERGVGLTEACGSGACAVAAMALTSDFSDRLSWIAVQQEGGTQFIKQTSSDIETLLVGSSHLVYRGTIEI